MKWPKAHFREFSHCNPHWKQKCGAFIEMLRKKSETLHKGFLYINTTCVNSPGLNSTLLHIGTPYLAIEVTSVINLTQGARPRWKFVYTWGVIGFCPPSTRATPLLGMYPYWRVGEWAVGYWLVAFQLLEYQWRPRPLRQVYDWGNLNV